MHEPGPMGHNGPPRLTNKEARITDSFERQKRPFSDVFLRPMVPVNVLILISLLGLNLGVKLYFKSERDRANLQQLEKEKMFLQLQYLKFQINPEAAKASLRELSVMMRFVLYEGDKDMVSLKKDVGFLRNYIKLMQLRYTDSLTVTVDIPEVCQTSPCLR